jgi:hypothetical protein
MIIHTSFHSTRHAQRLVNPAEVGSLLVSTANPNPDGNGRYCQHRRRKEVWHAKHHDGNNHLVSFALAAKATSTADSGTGWIFKGTTKSNAVEHGEFAGPATP